MEITLQRQRLIRRDEVEELTGFRRSQIYAMVKTGDFPAPFRIGNRAIAWKLGAVLDWIDARPVVETCLD